MPYCRTFGFSPHCSQSGCSNRWRLMASRGWEVTTSRSRQVRRGRRRTSAPLSRRLKARPRAPTCSPARRHNRYGSSAGRLLTCCQPIRLYPLCCCPESGGKQQRYIQIQKKKREVIIFTCLLAAPDSSVLSPPGP